jgi:CAAX protease family protein
MDNPALSASRRTLRDWVERYPLITFISLAYGISWAALLLAHNIDLGASNAFSAIMAAGPAFAGSLTWSLLRPEASGVPARKRWQLFGILTILLMALCALRRIWFAAGLVHMVGRVARPVPYPTWAAPVADILGAAAIALFLSGVHSPRQGVRDFLRSFDQRRQPLRWYWWLVGIGLYPVVVLTGNAVWAALGQALPTPQTSGPWHWLAVDAVLFFLYVMIAGGGLEEPGWRGFALPLLQKRFNPLLSSLILAVIWAFWHWPLFWLGYSEGGPFAVLLYALGAVPLAILLTAAFNRSGGSLPVVVLMHTSFNITSAYLPASSLATGLWMLLILIIAAWMWRSPQAFSLNGSEISERPAASLHTTDVESRIKYGISERIIG